MQSEFPHFSNSGGDRPGGKPALTPLHFPGSRALRAAMISFYYYPGYSGAAKQLATLAAELKKFGFDSFVITAWLDPGTPQREFIGGIEVVRVPVGPNRSLLRFWRGMARVLWLRRKEYAIVHSHGINPFQGFSLFCGRLLGKRCIGKLSIANSDIAFGRQGRIVGTLHKMFLKSADRYVAISSALKAELENSGLSAGKCLFIPNGVDTKKFFPADARIDGVDAAGARKSLGLGRNEVVLLYMGVIDTRKGIDVLIPAFAGAVRGGDGFKAKLVLVGPRNRSDLGSEFYNLMKGLTADLGISDKVLFLDYTANPAVFYRMADIFVLPSRQEGMPNAVIEAMACGLPVIGTRISGTEDLVIDGINGKLVRAGDVKQLQQAMKELIVSRDLRVQMGRKSLEMVRSEYNINTVARKYRDVYLELIFKPGD